MTPDIVAALETAHHGSKAPRILLPRFPSAIPSASDGAGFEDASAERAARTELPSLLSVAEVCAIFRRTDRTLRTWVSRGYLTRVEIGGAVFFREDDVRALIEGHVRDAVLLRSDVVGMPRVSSATLNLHPAFKR